MAPQDRLAQVGVVGGRKPIAFTSIRAKVNQLLATLPPEARRLYEQRYGETAREKLKTARAKGDPQLVAEVAQRYLYTEAGIEAVVLRATYHLSRDESKTAALCFDNLIRRQDADKLAAWTLVKMAVAYYRDGRKEDGDRVWRWIEARAEKDGGVQIGKQLVPLDKLEEARRGVTPEGLRQLAEWPYYRGGPGRTEQGQGGAPYLESIWSLSTLPTKSDVKSWTEAYLNKATTDLKTRNVPPLHTYFPVSVGNRMLYRSYDGVYAVSLKQEGMKKWWHFTEGGLQNLLNEPTKKTYLEGWKNQFQQMGPFGALFENSTTGTLTTDGSRVFFIDDLALPPPMNNIQMGFNPGMPQNQFGPLTEQVNRNTLKCINLESGKLHWELGGKFDTSEFKETFFLGAPLALGGKLYLLNEKNSEVRLVCLEPKDTYEKPVAPEVVWVQSLGNAQEKVQFDYHRRTNAVHLAYSEGILVVPTNAGAVYGVDLMDHSYVWVYPYREAGDGSHTGMDEMPQIRPGLRRPMPMMPVAASTGSEWKTSAPAVVDGKVVFTAPDTNSLHCLDLRSGSPMWKIGRANDDLYFAGVFAGKALIVGKSYVRAVRLDNGQPAGRIDNMGVICGQGAASDNVYYVPVTEAGPTRRQSGVVGVDMERLVARPLNVSRKGEVPGNLVFHDGLVLSQTLTGITAFPQLKAKLALIDERIKANPKDPIGLLERGELRLDKGDLRPAYEDLHAALDNNLPENFQAKLKLKLYETLTELLQRDFGAAEGHLDEYKTLCEGADNPEERLRRTGELLCLVAKGREDQGKLVDAFDAYMKFGALGGATTGLIGARDEPTTKSRPDVWARGRITAMLAKATPEQRKPLEDRIATEWHTLRDNGDVNALRKFVGLFGTGFAAGKEARLHLAERLTADAKDNKADELREAQTHLLQLASDASEPQLAGQALDDLARLMLRKGLMDHAAFYYRKLAAEFPKVVVRDGKTGAELYSELTTDKRFLPYLEEPRQSWHGKFKVSEAFGQFNMQSGSFALEGNGELVPFFQQHRLAVLPGTAHLQVVNSASNQEVWKSEPIPSLQYLNMYNQMQVNPRATFAVIGHVAVVPLGYKVYGIDPVDQKKLWEFNLYQPDPTKPDANNVPQIMQLLPEANNNIVVAYADGYKLRLGQVSVASAASVCLQTRYGLYAVDPLKGTVLWTRADVGSQAVLLGDDRLIYAIDVDDKGATGACQAFRAEDGVRVAIPDFSAAYRSRLRVMGRHLLVKDDLAEGKVGLRLYDLPTGKDVWKQEFPAGSFVLQGDAEAAGVVGPDGTVTLLDVKTGATAMKGTVRKDDLDKVESAHMLRDRDLLYVVLNKAIDKTVVLNVWPNTNATMHSMPVNGAVYAFDRETGKTRWATAVAHQMLVLEQFQDLPVLFFTSRVNKMNAVGGNRFNQFEVMARAVHKQTGKLIYDKALAQNGNNLFHQIASNPKAGFVEFTSFNFQIKLALENPETTGDARPPAGGDGAAVGRFAELPAPPSKKEERLRAIEERLRAIEK